MKTPNEVRNCDETPEPGETSFYERNNYAERQLRKVLLTEFWRGHRAGQRYAIQHSASAIQPDLKRVVEEALVYAREWIMGDCNEDPPDTVEMIDAALAALRSAPAPEEGESDE